MKIGFLCLLSKILLFFLKKKNNKIFTSPKKVYLLRKTDRNQYVLSESDPEGHGIIDFKDAYYFPTFCIHLILFLFRNNKINIPIKINIPKVSSHTLGELLTP